MDGLFFAKKSNAKSISPNSIHNTQIFNSSRRIGYVPLKGVEVNVIEGLWGLLKKEWRASRGGISREHCELFIAFFTWKHQQTDGSHLSMMNCLLQLIADNGGVAIYK